MSGRTGSGVVVETSSSSSTSKSHPLPTFSSTTSSKFIKNTVGAQQHKPLTSPTMTGTSSSYTSATSKTPADPAAGKESSSSKLARRDSVKSKTSDSGNRKSILGWIRQHIGDANDGGKSSSVGLGSSSSSSSRGTKKKLETAASFARSNHLSDSMPSLLVQLNSSSSASPSTQSNSVNYSSSLASSSTSGLSGTGDVINYRLKKNPAVMATIDDGGISGSARTKSSRPLRTLSGRNRWSSYDITGVAGVGLPLVTVEDSDESTPGEDDERALLSPTTVPHHQLLGARSVEALYIVSGAGDEHSRNVRQQDTSNDRSNGSSTDLAVNTAITTTSNHDTVPTRHGRCSNDDLLDDLRSMDERILKARGDRNQLIADVLGIPRCSSDATSEKELSMCKDDIDRVHRELLVTSLKEVDRLTSCICDLLRITRSTNDTWSTRTTCQDSIFTDPNDHEVDIVVHSNKMATVHRNCLSPDEATLRVFHEIGVRLQQQLSQLKQSLVTERFEVKHATESPPSEQQKTIQTTIINQVIMESDFPDELPDLKQPTANDETVVKQPVTSSGWPIEITVDHQSLHSSDVIIEFADVSNSNC